MKRQAINSALVGGIIGSVILVVALLLIDRIVPLQTQDTLSFIALTISIVIAAYTLLGSITLNTSWNDIDERSERIVAKYEDRAKQSIDSTKQDITKDLNSKQIALSEMTQQYKDQLTQQTKDGIKKQKTVLSFSLMLIGGLMVGTYLHQRFPLKRIRKWTKR